MEAREPGMKKLKLIAAFLIFIPCAIAAVFYVIPEKFNKSGLKINAEKYLENAGLLEDTEDLKFMVLNYADAEFKGRAVKGAVVKVQYTLIDRQEGVKEPKCFYIPALLDKEFDVYRGMTLIDCDDNQMLSKWKGMFKLGGYVYVKPDPLAQKRAQWYGYCQSRELPDEISARKVSFSDEKQKRACNCIMQKNPEAVDTMLEYPESKMPLGNGGDAQQYYSDLSDCINREM
ncbi:hypothetical protein [Pseudomonas guariconensis]|uniref:hypothetical protein n=1 Tax=Pseudomonas guariconensis TaxID=1288410 RepID=UPI0018A8BE6B|nr:hypothetical protein [Pseudomonas guariconensis]MBF8755511.1 hypothetical protein [Pseudomonas guariconensis]